MNRRASTKFKHIFLALSRAFDERNNIKVCTNNKKDLQQRTLLSKRLNIALFYAIMSVVHRRFYSKDVSELLK